MKRKAERTKSLNCGNGGIGIRDRIKEPLFLNMKVLPPVCGWLCLRPLLEDPMMVLGFP